MESHEDNTTTDPLEDGEAVEISEDAAAIIEKLQKERDDAIEARTRALADYQNFQRRARENEAREREMGIAEVARSLIPVLDQFEMALGQDSGETTVESLLKGIEIVRDELSKALNKTGVTSIEPVVGDVFDPTCQEAMLQQPLEGVEPGHVSMVVQSGWSLKNQILRPAKVAIAPDAQSQGS
jgi:molecular chaperone GrpE